MKVRILNSPNLYTAAAGFNIGTLNIQAPVAPTFAPNLSTANVQLPEGEDTLLTVGASITNGTEGDIAYTWYRKYTSASSDTGTIISGASGPSYLFYDGANGDEIWVRVKATTTNTDKQVATSSYSNWTPIKVVAPLRGISKSNSVLSVKDTTFTFTYNDGAVGVTTMVREAHPRVSRPSKAAAAALSYAAAATFYWGGFAFGVSPAGGRMPPLRGLLILQRFYNFHTFMKPRRGIFYTGREKFPPCFINLFAARQST